MNIYQPFSTTSNNENLEKLKISKLNMVFMIIAEIPCSCKKKSQKFYYSLKEDVGIGIVAIMTAAKNLKSYFQSKIQSKKLPYFPHFYFQMMRILRRDIFCFKFFKIQKCTNFYEKGERGMLVIINIFKN